MKKTSIAPQESGIFTSDCHTEKAALHTSGSQIEKIRGNIAPQNDISAREMGDRCVAEIKASLVADFEKNSTYCSSHPNDHVDRMVHVSTFAIINGIIYMTYYANTGTEAEDPAFQEARFAFCPHDDPTDMTIIRLIGAGDTLDGRKIDKVYDTILLHKDDDVLYLMWTAAADGLYYRFYCTYTISSGELSSVRPNRFKVGETVNDFSISGITSALTENGIPYKELWSDIGIMQKLTTHTENGEIWYYTGAYSGNFNCIIKSLDFITWEYVSAPDFPNLSKWENAVFVTDDKCYYFVRQDDSCDSGFLTYYDLKTKIWALPCLIHDAQSRSDFIMYNSELYLIHAPIDRNGFGIVKINRENLSDSKPVMVCDMHDSLFYPFTDIYGEYAYMSYTVNRKHIRLSKFKLSDYLE